MILGHYQQDQNISYMSGGSGYVISSAGVQSMVEQGLAGRFFFRILIRNDF